ncbi:MarR family winged helix-turn-helix transcriptional regulator [Bacillus sp. FJAT-22090]|jgi:MarR family transcriptional regulator, organic hydroperoxide resistance regulator|uniref:MarR family winged helix-turn-helix transcriptional regulator n=1 Tax=Bacillus sp. FJAT-22090 TaxID=1581038 RepID=UPI0006AE5909|nr:MarR family transcriptional regulator [Bacillus sp. FJAT-22090]
MEDIKEISVYVKEAFALLEKVNSQVAKEFAALLENELTPKQLLILRTVRDEESITANELSERLSLSPSSISQLLNRLEAGKYLKREINVNNRREVIVILGDEGKSLFKEYEKIDESIIEKYYSEFTIDEVKTFRNLVLKLYNTIESKKRS